ncbi:NAD(P)/FAD-dependent oxidoreductase [Ktedonobacter robiniae]|uniref:Halogenase n=1 Tax=Ktedonobacter robiniae TaxID=2778365 RepID=A0ABQ3V5H6_9CHLR|nr:tryptophan 7-halogenase [Ktedonobacter robiniae]GHO60129.1 halogenase [Ktedonobacter robiniae]
MTEGLKDEYDIVICGAGLAGLTLARQITREIPEASLLLIEGTGDKSRTGAIQVGESTIEISANYLTNVLGLSEYFEATHYHKWGLRFFFGSGTTPIEERPELGTSHASPKNSFQLDRAMLETDLKRFNADLGVQMLAESKVEEIHLAQKDGLHEIVVVEKPTKQRHVFKCRWVIDAMGRRRYLQKKLGVAEPANPHHSSSWFRLPGRIDICDLVPRTRTDWHKSVPDNNRYYSTNHLMDNGRWVWLIPLASRTTSVGIVTHEEHYPFEEYNTYEKAMQWLQKYEPLLWNYIHTLQPIDFQCLRHYSYSSKQVYSTDRWACTGDAGVFSDPFLSPGIDQAGFGNTIITNMIKLDRAGALTEQLVEHFNESFLSFHNVTSWITQPAYNFFGNGVVMGVKLMWDFARGFSLNASNRFNQTYLDLERSQALQPMLSRLFNLTVRMEKLFKAWADHSSKRYTYTFVDYFAIPGILDLYMQNFQTGKSLEELVADHQVTLAYMEELVQIIFLIALADTMPETLKDMPSPLWLNAWGVGLDPKRWQRDKLFAPASSPRHLHIVDIAQRFGVTDIEELLTSSRVAIS